MSKEEILEELERCKVDPVYFIKKYVNVTHPIKGIIPFELYNFQERIVTEIDSHRFNIIRKFRQAGVTTIMCAYSLWTIIFNDSKNVMVVSIGDRESTAFLERVYNMYVDLPTWLKPSLKERNKHNIVLSTKSRIRSQPAGAGRGESVSLLIVDEAAFVEKMRDFWAAFFPTISTGGNVVLLSTVNGMSNLYYELYQKAAKKENTFNVIDIHWQEHPEYTAEWSKEMRPAIGERMWAQEYECEFLGTGDTFVDGDTLKKLMGGVSDEYEESYNKRLRTWQPPDQYHTYLISVDASYGREFDYSAFHVINIYNGEQVAEFYSNKTGLKELAEIIVDLGNQYNGAHVAVERNGLGLALIERLFEDFEYENLWLDEKGEFGMLVTGKTREILLANLEETVRTFKIRLNSERTVNELLTFVISETGKIQADDGYNDDLVLSLALASTVMKTVIDSSPVEISQSEVKMKLHHPNELSSSKYNVHKDIDMKDYTKWLNDN